MCDQLSRNYFYRAKTIENIIFDFGESISRAGFNKIIIVNHHLDLGHIKSIENAKSLLSEKYSLKILEVASRIIYSKNKEEDETTFNNSLDMEKEMHADFRETSHMLFKHSKLVKDCYIGTPAKASREQGEIQFKEMVKKTSELIQNFIINDYIPDISEKIKSTMNHIVLR